MSTEAFPLQWPAGYLRTRNPQRARFDASFARARDGILHEIRLLGGKLPVISTNIPLRRDGLPYASQAEPRDPGVAVYFQFGGRQVVLACDKWDRVTDNLRAIEKAIEAMRGLGRWGVSDMLERAFQGFAALPAPTTAHSECWWEILGVESFSSAEEIEAAYRARAKEFHPDWGGSGEAMARLNRAVAEARAAVERGVR